MPGRPLLFDLRCRNSTICRSCLSSSKRNLAQPWAAAYSSHASRNGPRRRVAPRRAASVAPSNPSEFELQQYAQRIQSLRDATPDSENADFSVRFFEQDGKTRTELADEQAFDDSLSKLGTSDMKDTLREMKESLSSPEEKEAFDDVMSEMGDSWDKLQSAGDLEQMMVKMQEYTRSIDAEIEEAGANLPKEIMEHLTMDLSQLDMEDGTGMRSRVDTPQIPERPWTPNQRRKISRLNLILARVFRETRREPGLNKKSIQSVYKAYHAARLPLAHGWGNVPLDVWDLLWAVFSADESINSNRLSHVAMLARDMSEAKVTLTPPQQLLTVEAVFVDGWESKAIDNWKRCMSTLGAQSSETFQDFWELGVRMYCRVGDMEQAERAVTKLLDQHMSPRIMMTLIRTWSEQGNDEGREKAWAAYWQMRQLLGKEMKLSDYDQVVSYFLTTNQTENALYAFVDMMSDGQIDLKRQKYMPSVIANKFFLGKWLKRLIGAGDMDGAYNVVEFMRGKGVEAAPIHLNGLIGAWQRSGGAEDAEKADQLAWKMIESRIEFVSARSAKSRGGAGTIEAGSGIAPWPRATLETFSVLAENYRMRGLHDRLQVLWDASREAEISPDAFMMNQLLESHIQGSQAKEAVALYHSLVDERGVTPDPYTFSALWKTLAVNRLHVVSPESAGEETNATRLLFKETVKYKSVFLPGGMDGQLARKILHTFRRMKDDAGFLVALTALKDVFKFLPPETLVLEMILGTTKLSWDAAASRRRLMIAKRDMDRELLAWAEGDADKLEGAKRGEALYEYLQKKFWPDMGADADKGKQLVLVARQMGVYELLAPKKGGKRR